MSHHDQLRKLVPPSADSRQSAALALKRHLDLKQLLRSEYQKRLAEASSHSGVAMLEEEASDS